MLNAIIFFAAHKSVAIEPSRRALTPANNNSLPEPPPAASLRLPPPLRTWLMVQASRAAA